MQAASGADGSQCQEGWIDAFVTIMKGEPRLNEDKLREALQKILENRLQGSSVAQMLTEESEGNKWLLNEICQVYIDLIGEKEVAYRVGLLGTFYMKSLAETTDGCSNKKQASPYDEERMRNAMEALDAKELYERPEVSNWLKKYCVESSKRQKKSPNLKTKAV